ncbi:hypothetical protein ACFE04_001021 [Oxalis oulophora]
MAVIESAQPPKKKKEPTEEEKRRTKIVPGSLMKALIRPGGGQSTPSDGDQVIYHSTVRTLDGVVVESTRSEYGGKGIPIRHVLGKSKILLGLLEGIPTMEKGEVAMFKMKPSMHYGEDDCPLSAPTGFPKDDELHFEIEMLEFAKAKISVSSIVDSNCNDVTLDFQAIGGDFGVVKKIINDGQGWESPREPYEVKAWISAKSGDGKVILSRTDGEPYFFTFGRSEVPKGLEMGIGTMTRQEKAVIYVTKPYLTTSTLMPEADSFEEIHFEVELVQFIQVRDVLGDGRLMKRRLRDGNGVWIAVSVVYFVVSIDSNEELCFTYGCSDSLLRVHYKGMLLNEENKVFYDSKTDNNGQPLEFSSGEGMVPEGFEMCVRLMLPGELAVVTCPPDYAYDKFPRPAGVPEGADIKWIIELLGFETPKDWTGMNFQSIMDDAEKTRSTGNRLFKEGKYALAKAKYEKVLREFNHVNPQDDDEGKVFSDTRNLLHLNVAACFLKMGECRKSIETCNKVLDANSAHVKALYRRGMAFLAAGEFEDARNDFNMMIKVDKSAEPDATAGLQKLKKQEQDAQKKARKQFKGLFDKKPGEISEVGIENKGDDLTSDNEKINSVKKDSDGDESEESFGSAADEAPERGWLYRLWPTGGRIFSALGLQRCEIL